MHEKRIRLGVLVPSSNTALEPLTTAMLSSLHPHVTVHFSRFAVTTISLAASSNFQFAHERILAAAELLAHAQVDVIGWSGTSAGWLGFSTDEDLCAAITAATGGIPAVTSTLALNHALEQLGVKKLGLVTPYTDDVQARIVENYKAAGIEINGAIERHLGVTENIKIADIGEDVLDRCVAEVARGGAEAVTTFCTNLVAAQRVDYWEQEFQIPVLDSVTTVVWDMLRTARVDMSPIKGWGLLFDINQSSR